MDMKRFGFVAVALLGLILAVAAVACSSDDDDGDSGDATATPEEMQAEIPVVAFNALEYQYDLPDTIAGGPTQLSMSNIGGDDHIAVFFQLNDDVTYDDFTVELESIMSEGEAEPFGTLVSGTGAGPGGSSDVVLDLNAGTYAVLCSVPDAEGTPHYALGMIQQLEVTEAPAEAAELPAADVTVRLSDFAFDAPDTLAAGPATFEAINDGPQPHELAVLALDDGFTAEALVELLSSEEPPPADAGPPPFSIAGAAVAMSSGQSALTTIDLAAGTYALICFVGDADTGAPHFLLGMVDSFTVE